MDPKSNLFSAIQDTRTAVVALYLDKKRRFDSVEEAQHWLSQYCTVSVISNSDLDVANSNYAWCGVIWGDETHRPIEATIVRTQDIPRDDLAAGRAKIFGAGGLKELWKSQPTEAQKEAGNYKKKHIRFQGMDVSIENDKGTTRTGESNGKKWSTKMHYAYGYIRRTEGTDGDHVDVYVGPNEDATNVFVVHQAKPNTGEYDEDKCMLGFDDAEEAKTAYLKQYDSDKYFGAISTIPIALFKEKVFDNKGAPVVPNAKELVKKHLPGRHNQETHATHEPSQQRQGIQRVFGVNNSEYKYGRQSSVAIKTGEKAFMRVAASVTQKYDGSNAWKTSLSADSRAAVGDQSFKDSIATLSDKGMHLDADKLRSMFLNDTIDELTKLGDGNSKIGSNLLDGVQATARATEWLKSSVRTNIKPATLALKDGEMSNCSPEAINLAANATNPGQSLTHEYGHWMSYHDKGVYSATDSFLKSRAGPVIKIKGYKGTPTEEAYSDKFVNPSVGKVYAHAANEVLAVGMQMMYASPRAFLRTDPDHFYLTLGLMTSGGQTLKSELEELEAEYLPLEILEIVNEAITEI